MTLQQVTVFCAFLALTSGDVLRYKFPSAEQTIENAGKHWAVLVAGSNRWMNYRHQADVCHAYQVLIKHGFSQDRIITFMFDDIAQNMRNPTPGVIINHPNGTDVYRGVKIDYKHFDVTPELFLSVLKGDATAVKGKGTGRVLKSGPNDHVFVNFVDHGGPGILGFPDEYLKASQLMEAVQYMYKNQMYKQMVMYIEACESGSMFEGLMPDNINVYVTTAANAEESSYACYLDEQRETYLGDVYSVKWMEDSDVEDLTVETLHKQYKIVKEETNTSHVMQYGDKTIAKEDVSEFQGGINYQQPPPQVLPKVELNAVPSEKVALSILQHQLKASSSEEQRKMIQKHIDWHLMVEERVEGLMQDIVGLASKGDSTMSQYLMATRYRLKDLKCYEAAVDAFHAQCVRIPQNDYALRRLYILANLCEAGISPNTILSSISNACTGTYRM